MDEPIRESERGLSTQPFRLAQADVESESQRLFRSRPIEQADWDAYKLANSMITGGRFLGLDHSSDHLQHYLDGGEMGPAASRIPVSEQWVPPKRPKPLQLNVDRLLADVSGLINLRGAADKLVYKLEADIQRDYSKGRRKLNFTTRNEVFGVTAGSHQDWFYALGRFTISVAAQVKFHAPEPSNPVLSITYSLHVKDFYDWDRGAINLPIPNPETGGDMQIDDKVLRRLHMCGLAREYPIMGQMTLIKNREIVVMPINAKRQ